MNNIFNFATKELVLDAFICWLVNFSKSNRIEEKKVAFQFLNSIYKINNHKEIGDIKKINRIERQFGDSRIDVYIEVILENDRKIHFIFENKTFTSHHSNQLKRHTEYIRTMVNSVDEETVFTYLKIGYIYPWDLDAKGFGFKIINLERLLEILKEIKIDSEIFIMYRSYLENIKKQYDELKNLSDKQFLLKEEKEKIFSSVEGSFYYMEKIYNRLQEEGLEEEFYIYNGTSFGRPWVQISFFDRKISEESRKSLFWRLDYRTNHDKEWLPYICLRQYRTKKDDQDDIELKKYRKIFQEIAKNYNELEFGIINDGGNQKEREIGILFFNQNNSIGKIMELIPKFTKEFIEKSKA